MDELPDDLTFAGALALSDASKLPEWLQAPALGHNMEPIARLVIERVYPYIADRVRAEADEHYAQADNADLTDAFRELGEMREQMATVRAEAVAEKARLICVNQSLYGDLLRAEHRTAEAVAEHRAAYEAKVEDLRRETLRTSRVLREFRALGERLQRQAGHRNEYQTGLRDGMQQCVEMIDQIYAAGSVPVATPPGLDLSAMAAEALAGIVAAYRAAGKDTESEAFRMHLAAKVAEEGCEVLAAYLHATGWARRGGTWEEFDAELADTVISAFLVAVANGRDLPAAIEAKHKIVMARGFKEPGPVATPTEPDASHVCSEKLCPVHHHAWYGQLCTVPDCDEDWCTGSKQEPAAASPVPAEQPAVELACELCRRIPPGHERGCLRVLAEQMEAERG